MQVRESSINKEKQEQIPGSWWLPEYLCLRMKRLLHARLSNRYKKMHSLLSAFTKRMLQLSLLHKKRRRPTSED